MLLQRELDTRLETVAQTLRRLAGERVAGARARFAEISCDRRHVAAACAPEDRIG